MEHKTMMACDYKDCDAAPIPWDDAFTRRWSWQGEYWALCWYHAPKLRGKAPYLYANPKIEAAIKQAAEDTWDAIAYDALKANAAGEGDLNDHSEPTNSMDRDTVIEVVADHIRSYGNLTPEQLVWYEGCKRQQAFDAIGANFPDDSYGY